MTTFGLSAFLKLVSSTGPRQRTLIAQRTSAEKKSGYDFHREMRSICGRLLSEEITLEVALGLANAIKKDPERSSALGAIGKLVEWRKKFDGSIFPIERRVFESPRGLFKVRSDFDFGTNVESHRIAIHLWNTKDPAIDSRLGRAALALFPDLYRESDLADFAVLSLRDKHLLRLSDSPEAETIAPKMVEALEDMFTDIKPKRPRPSVDDRPSPAP
jgi:hypothetical protein